MAAPIRWGIIGTGAIAKKFAADLAQLPDTTLIAVGSRTSESARAFAKQFGIERAYGSYEELVSDKDVDAVYVATPHSCHCENAMLALHAGKATLCEKPFTINTSEATEVIALARQKRILLMEAMWTRFFPLMRKLRELLKQRVIGDIQVLNADFGFRAAPDEKGRLMDPKLGGGALLDVGIYPLSLSSMIFGAPSEIQATAILNDMLVDEQTGISLKFPQGQIAMLYTSIRVNTSWEAELVGTQGRIKIHSAWWKPSAMTIFRDGKEPERIEMPHSGNGYQFEAEEFMRCLRAEKTECDIMPLDETLAIMKTMDLVRSKIGLKYPME